MAYDLNEGTIKWRIPLGNIPELAAKGIRTAGDSTVRAFDKETGNTLWEKQMESHPESIPAVYEVGGRQYVAFFLNSAAGGNPEAQGYHVFALPKAAASTSRK